ncbi:MAG: oxidative damage protection protein [Gammaproteobacteria bacterium]|nr:oxidative damage protection protein [Gammaproteobacteria bacterium]
MAKMIQCVVLKTESEALESAPHPGELGLRILESVSAEGWKKWHEHLTMIINENGLNTADPRSLEVIEKHMLGFLFNEGEFSGVDGFKPPQAKK